VNAARNAFRKMTFRPIVEPAPAFALEFADELPF
jgi:hypothetical protein